MTFKRYCLAIYKKDLVSWLQLLPSFLEWEARAIAQAFGYKIEYCVVKQKLIEEFSQRKSLGNNVFSDFFSASSHKRECLMCFSTRLGTLAQKVTSAAVGSRDAMVKSKFLSSLPLGLLNQVNIQL